MSKRFSAAKKVFPAVMALSTSMPNLRRGFAVLTLTFLLIILPMILFVPLNTVLQFSIHKWLYVNSTDVSAQNHLIQEFQREWLRHRRVQVDWKRLITACLGQEGWGTVKQGWAKQNRTNAASSTISHWDVRPAGEYSKLFIQSRTADGRVKNIGGDSWRVYLRGASSLAATVFDHNNGSYEVLFLLLEPGVYRVLIYLDYSLCDGFKDPPREWFITGGVDGQRHDPDYFGKLDDYLLQDFNLGKQPLMIMIQPRRLGFDIEDMIQPLSSKCSDSCNFLWNGFGRWHNGTWKPYIQLPDHWIKPPRSYNATGTLQNYGDSLMKRFHTSIKNHRVCKQLFQECGLTYAYVYRFDLVSKKMKDLDFDQALVISGIRDELSKPHVNSPDSVFILNLGLHYIKTLNFSSYQKLLEGVIQLLRETETNAGGQAVPKYKSRFIWKTSTAIHKENGKFNQSATYRFFTYPRDELFSTYSAWAMCRAGFDVVDVFHFTHSYPGGTLDHCHYNNHVFVPLEKLLEKLKLNPDAFQQQDDKVKMIRCIA